MTQKVNDIIDILEQRYPDALCALHYSKDYELMIAVRMGDLYGIPGSIVCGTHCIRICGRLGLSEGKDPEKVERQLRKLLPPEKSSDFCHRIVLFGRDICTARSPKCSECPLAIHCKHMNG